MTSQGDFESHYCGHANSTNLDPIPPGREARVRRLRKLGNRCVCCNTTWDLTVDHIVPLSRGGRKGHPNLQLLCSSCNQDKAAQLMGEWTRCHQNKVDSVAQ